MYTLVITTNVWKITIEQAILQLTITLVTRYGGKQLFGYSNSPVMRLGIKTMLFNQYVREYTDFSPVNNHMLDRKFKMFI